MRHLINRHRFIHPDSIKVWNAYVSRERCLRTRRGDEANTVSAKMDREAQ
jgi:hypothetical protein